MDERERKGRTREAKQNSRDRRNSVLTDTPTDRQTEVPAADGQSDRDRGREAAEPEEDGVMQ